ncbi:hypothetical protein [Aeoliella sp.]|uniref:hypothetical protein n=1 Tax=Aeoliella sp. TaxID=2795800 RepID=UPI003CCBC727
MRSPRFAPFAFACAALVFYPAATKALEPPNGETVVIGSAGEVIRLRSDFIAPGDQRSFPSIVGTLENELLFSARNYGSAIDPSLWTVTGDVVSPVAIANNQPLEPIVYQPSAAYAGKLYFNSGSRLSTRQAWQYDGSVAEPATDLGLSWFQDTIEFQGKLYLERYYTSQEVLVFDGSQAQGITLPAGLREVEFLYADDQRMLLSARDSTYGNELWQYDGDQFEHLLDLNPGTDSAYYSDIVAFDGALYFTASVDGIPNLWRLEQDGATQLSPTGVSATSLTVYDGELYFVSGIESGTSLWRLDGDSVEEVWRAHAEGFGFVSNLTVFNGLLYSLSNDAVHGEEIWAWDGQAARLVADLNAGPAGIMGGDPFDLQMTQLGNQLFFIPGTGAVGGELWSLTPVPEPSAVWLGILGLTAAVAGRQGIKQAGQAA